MQRVNIIFHDLSHYVNHHFYILEVVDISVAQGLN